MSSPAKIRRPQLRSNHGAALITVLFLIVLVASMVAIFLVRTAFERSSSANYDAVTTTQRLADNAVNLVQATINQATSTPSHSWASQPGLIRVFDDSGDLTALYRLYSGTELATSTSSANTLASDIPPANWASSPATWVDLNRPVTVTSLDSTIPSYLAYPILDPRDPSDPGTLTQAKVSTSLPGFAIQNAPGATAVQPAPMPVRWLYVLRDGTLVSPSTPTGDSVTIPGATTENPITGRIAFWSDDETTKVNLNTAAGSRGDYRGNGKLDPAPWDVPRFNLSTDRILFADHQPVQGEYQRYPGHPASTDLTEIFTALDINTPSNRFSLLPRYNNDAGSQGGTVNTTSTNAQNTVSVKNEHLYTSAGELLFTPDRTLRSISHQQAELAKFFLTTTSRSPDLTLFGTPRIGIWPLDSAYASNPGPSNNTPLASTFDKLITFCTSTGPNSSPKLYSFQRHDSTSPTNDWTNIERNRTLYSYLQNLSARQIPGFGGSFLQKYNHPLERDQILTEIVDYIRCTNLYDHAIKDADPSNPGPRFTPRGDNPTTGWGQVAPLKIGNTRGLGRIYTLSEIGIHLICTADGNGLQPSEAGSASDWRSVSNVADPDTKLKTDSGGDVTPTFVNPTLADTYGGPLTALTPGQKRLQAVILFEVTSPMLGFDAMMPDLQIQITDLSTISIDGNHPFPSGTLITESMGTRFNTVQQIGGLNGFQYFVSRVNWANNTRRNGWSNPAAPPSSVPYRFVSNPFTVSTSDNVMNLSGGPFKIELLVKQKGGGGIRNVVQTFLVTLPPTDIPIPDLLKYGITASTGTANSASDWWSFDKRIQWSTSSPSKNGNLELGTFIRTDPLSPPSGTWTLTSMAPIPVIPSRNVDGTQPSSLPPSDVVRTFVAKAGDIRLVAAQDTVTADNSAAAQMVKHTDYDSSSKLVHSFMQAATPFQVTGVDLGGKLVAGTDYDYRWTPKVPSDVTPGADWDWDTGLPGSRDGAYANKPDEGNIYTSSGASPYYNGENQENNPSNSNLPTYFTANRILPSAVMFGSLPTGVKEGIPWRTLLFRPQINRPRDAVSTSGKTPKDHLLLDLFTMPVVEPYAISEPFSTAGKVNMNYQIIPFTYLDRSTGIRAVLSSELVARVPKAAAKRNASTDRPYYKIEYGSRPGTTDPSLPDGAPQMARLPLNLSDTNGTLRQFKEKFANWDVFKSPTEICDIYLVPEGYSWTSNAAADAAWYGDDFALVGDNVRERPYANLLPRLTTKSNTFTVYYTVQALKNPPGQNPASWNESRGKVTGELRGSTTIERYLDPANPDLPDYAVNPNAPSLETYYQWRILDSYTFDP